MIHPKKLRFADFLEAMDSTPLTPFPPQNEPWRGHLRGIGGWIFWDFRHPIWRFAKDKIVFFGVHPRKLTCPLKKGLFQ